MRELVYYVAVSLDGYIAGPNGEFDAFLVEGDHMVGINERFADTIPTDYATALGIDQSGGGFDTVLMGADTYAVGLPEAPSPYRHLDQYVFTHRKPEPVDGVTFTDRDPVELVRELKSRSGKDIWLCGGGSLATQLIGEIDRLVLKRQPLLFGDGISLFAPGTYAPGRFERVSNREFETGVSFTEYVRA
ncbi:MULTISPECIES: dihydrofolate reductase family protein [Gordonia]|uniref:Bacterial bifunctional deaminase-reductase C-terminal domain-containing protein n=2 Tax=Gordonia alkanivorans TaxID=84096 RepID=F9W2M4_9ACTN|nr:MULTISPECIES: dihydrofolate reductase family protein [Gordonia]ETA08199.1 riboflavin biosynthesis protein RibD [Gordonia alkanivorans CGMCC 6845]MDH3012838.1 dihydrofolate reductase family protein [Gordonia alkanivorans]MDH3021690.1 dihydrofolate reductase family protein [Gordonia alkanivorans]MDH3025648.1 dihydrofolate reductase family protein [Gordonia alkanivorans]MDJ0009361.1 dihydrofolate reductase family protein [Gordonia alkanivorans]